MASTAFAPGNVSCIFRIVENKDPLKKHSLGVGFTVNKGVVVSVRKFHKDLILFNNKKINFPTVSTVKDKLLKNKKILIKIKSVLKLGAGFGLSGASALAAAYAINKEFNLKKTNKQLAMVAHYAEVLNHTGLGDVGGQFNGGFMMKYKRGKPLSVIQLPVKDKNIYYNVFSSIDTKKVITNNKIKDKINKAGDSALKKILLLIKNKKFKNIKLKKINLKKIIEVSKEFAIESGLLKNKQVIELIKKIEKNNGAASMIMLGNAVFADKPFPGSKKLAITNKNARLI